MIWRTVQLTKDNRHFCTSRNPPQPGTAKIFPSLLLTVLFFSSMTSPGIGQTAKPLSVLGCIKSPQDAASATLKSVQYRTLLKSGRHDTLPETGVGGVLGIRALDVNNAGRILLVDSRQRRITLRDSRLQVVTSIGNEGEGPGEFRTPILGVFGPDGRIWVVDMSLSRTSVYAPDGKFIRAMPRMSLDTRSIVPLPNDAFLGVGASRSAQGNFIVTRYAREGSQTWRAVPLDSALLDLKLIIDAAWSTLESPNTALVGMAALPTITRVDVTTGQIRCSSRVPVAAWHQLSAQEKPKQETLAAMQRWVTASSRSSGIGVLTSGHIVLDIQPGTANSEDHEWIVFSSDLMPQLRVTGVPGRLLQIRKDTVWMASETTEGTSVLSRSLINVTLLSRQ